MALKNQTHEARIKALEDELRLLADAHNRSTRGAHQLVEHLGGQVIQGGSGHTYYVMPKYYQAPKNKWWPF